MTKPIFDIKGNIGEINIENVEQVGNKTTIRLKGKDVEIDPNKK